MIHLFTNTNSNVKVASYVKDNTNSIFTETSSENYTILTKEGQIKLDIQGFEFRVEQSVSSARLICFFEKLTSSDVLVLKDQDNNIIDKVIVGAKKEYSANKITNYVSFDITRFLAKRAKIGLMSSLYLTWSGATSKKSVNFVSFKYIDNQNAENENKSEYIMVSYANIEGIESHFAFDQKNLGASGSTLVNIRQGNLIYCLPISLKNRLDCDIELALTFNSLKENEETKYGMGFKGPIDYILDTSLKEKGIIKLTNQTLKKAYFTKLSEAEKYNLTSETKKDVYYCFADSTYIVCESDSTFTFIWERNKINFKQNGTQTLVNYFLFENGTKIPVEYENNKVFLVHPNNMKDELIYDTNHLIRFESKRLGIVTTFSYNNNHLIHVKTGKITLDFANNMSQKAAVIRETRFTYSENKLTQIYNSKEGRAIDLKYDGNKIKSISECVINMYGTKIDGNKDTFEYGSVYTIVNDRKGNKTYYHFDSYGSCVYTLDQNCVSNNFKFGTISDSDQNAQCHKLRSKYQSQGNIPNLLYNGSFECDDTPLTGWDIISGQDKNVSLSKDSLYGENCLSINASKTNKFIFKQEIKQDSKGVFKLTGFYKSYKTSSSDSSNIDLTITYIEKVTKKAPDYRYSGKTITEEITNVKNESITLPLTEGKWEFFESELISVPGNASFDVIITCSSEIYFDELQFTKNNFLVGHNYLKNSHFENSKNGVLTSWLTIGTTDSDGIVSSKDLLDSSFLSEMIEGNVYKLTGTYNSQEKVIYQKINLKGDSGERLLINCWLFGDKTLNEKLQLEVSIHYNYLTKDKLKKYIVMPTNNEEGWHLLTSLITTEYTYDYVIVKVIHNGFNSIYLDAIQLFKTKIGSTFSYDERGNLMSAEKNGQNAESSFDKDNRMIRKSCTNGQQFHYTYSDQNGKLIRIVDNFGNNVSFQYPQNGIIKEIKSKGKVMRTSEQESDNGLIVKENELGHKTITAVDEFGKVTTYVDAKGCVIRRVYDEDQRPIEIQRSSKNEMHNQATISYTSIGAIKDIICPNNTNVSMLYDDFGNRIQTSINNQILEQSIFNTPYDALVNELIVNGNTQNRKSISYDSKGNIQKVLVDEEEVQKYKYDDLGRLVEVKDYSQNKAYHFNYDMDGTLLSITNSDDTSINYDMDNLNNVEKESIKIDDTRVAANYVYAYEFNEADRTTFFDRLSRTYLDDIIVGDNSINGLLGATPEDTSFRYNFDEQVQFKVIELSYCGKNLCYSLDKINYERQNDLSNGGKYNKYLWKINFEKSKTTYGWLRLLGTIQNKTILEFNGDNVSIKVIAVNDTKLRLSANNIVKDLSLSKDKLSNWNMYALSVFNQDGKTRVCLYFNGTFLYMISLNSEVANKITTLSIGDTQVEEDTTKEYYESNKTPIRIAMLSIGTYFYKKVNFKAIYNESRKFLFESSDEDANSGVCFETISNNDDDLISLNGSFTSLKRVTPIIVGYSDGSFKISKTRNFEFDKEINRHVYASFDGTLKLNDKNGCRLTYKPLMANAKYISLNFKPLTMDGDFKKRTLLSFMDSNSNEKFVVYLNENDCICYLKDSQIVMLGNLMSYHDRWNHFVLSNNSITLNGVKVNIPFIDLSTLTTNIGCSISYELGREIPCHYLNGYIYDILLSNNEQASNVHMSSVLSKYDTFGRKIKSEISFDEEALCTTTYSFVTPTDSNNNEINNRTSTLLKSESNEILGEINYEYDANNNVTSIQNTLDGSTKIDKFEYDCIERLISSSINNDNEFNTYKYDENGNILLHQIKTGEHLSTIEYIYDKNNQEKLTSMVKDGTTLSIQYGPNSLYPVKIGDKVLSWSLDQLIEIASPTCMIKNEYDFLNRRIKKISKNDEVEYIYDQQKLVAIKNETYKKIFIYNENDSIVGFINDKGKFKNTYFFVKDQLDIIRAVIDSNGNIIEHYEYDDYGLLKNHDQVDFDFNNIIYKGYLYDPETKWYLLGNRYYSPELKRFISPDKVDNIINTITDLAQFNLYAYCGNNPIMRFDKSGQNWFTNLAKKVGKAIVNTIKPVVEVVIDVIGVVLGTVVGAVVGGVSALMTSIEKNESFGDCVANTLQGIVDGTKIGFTAGYAGSKYLSGVIFNDDELKQMGASIFVNDVLPMTMEFVQNNYLGLMSILNGVHDLINMPEFISTLICNGYLLTAFICIAYRIIQSNTAENNYDNNTSLLGIHDEKLIPNMEKYISHDGKSYKVPLSPINVVIDGEIYVTNQQNEFFEKVMFGASPIRSNGCEVIATYNLLRYLIKGEKNFSEIIYYYEKKNLIFGVFGTFPQHIKGLLDLLSIDYYFSYNELDAYKFNINRFDAMIQTSFNNKYNGETIEYSINNDNDDILLNFIETYFMIHTTFIPKVKDYFYEYIVKNDNVENIIATLESIDNPEEYVIDVTKIEHKDVTNTQLYDVNGEESKFEYTTLKELLNNKDQGIDKVFISAFGFKKS